MAANGRRRGREDRGARGHRQRIQLAASKAMQLANSVNQRQKRIREAQEGV